MPNNEPPVFLERGETLSGLYRIESEPIKGGMGCVFRVHHNGWNIDLAMKQILSEFTDSTARQELFVREGRTCMELGLNPHVVTFYYMRKIGGLFYIFTEWMKGGSLAEYIASGKLYAGSESVKLKRILTIAAQMINGLRFVHKKELIHQDVKPSNFLLSEVREDGEAGFIKITDFGITKFRSTAEDGRGCRYTPEYCSPEQMGGGEITKKTDIYSWALCVLEMLLEDRPWTDGSVPAYARDYYLARLNEEVPKFLKSLLRICLDADANRRGLGLDEILAHINELNDRPMLSTTNVETSGCAALNNRALSYYDLGDCDNALRCWNQSLLRAPNYCETRINLAVFRYKTGKASEAEAAEMLAAVSQTHTIEDGFAFSPPESFNYSKGAIRKKIGGKDCIIRGAYVLVRGEKSYGVVADLAQLSMALVEPALAEAFRSVFSCEGWHYGCFPETVPKLIDFLWLFMQAMNVPKDVMKACGYVIRLFPPNATHHNTEFLIAIMYEEAQACQATKPQS